MYHDIASLFYLAVKDHLKLIPPTILQALINSYHRTIADNLKKSEEYQDIYRVFEEKDIPLVPIKGIALLSDIYSESLARPMIDIDVLVREVDISKACDILRELGYKKDLLGLEESYWLESSPLLSYL